MFTKIFLKNYAAENPCTFCSLDFSYFKKTEELRSAENFTVRFFSTQEVYYVSSLPKSKNHVPFRLPPQARLFLENGFFFENSNKFLGFGLESYITKNNPFVLGLENTFCAWWAANHH